MTQRVWISYHKDELVEEYHLKEDETHKLFATHKDVEGKNINHLNPVYSEMVTMWYVWKNNLKTDFVGFEHYRRRFNVSKLPKPKECQVYKIVDFDLETIYNQYARCHNGKDMDIVLGILDERYGKDNQYSKHIKESHWMISNCCFFMRWKDFTKMCAFLFPVLEDFAASCGISNTNVKEWRKKAIRDFGENDRTEYHTRVQSFLAERLISAWIATNLFAYTETRNVAIVHYNTPELTEAAILSLNKHTPGCRITVFDNSDKRPFTTKIQNVEIIDNTKGQIIDFKKELKKYPNKIKDDIKYSNFGSAKHSMSVDKLMDLLPEGFILMDSDVLIKKNISTLWNRNYACAGSRQTKHNVPLLIPFLCWLNVPLLRDNNIHYFNGKKMWALTDTEPDRYYDTGAWLLEEVISKGLPVGQLELFKYVVHYEHGSWRRDEEREKEWLEYNAEFWR